jgi:molecular chaperone DnaK (HSP70)
MSADNKTIGRFELDGIAPAPRGVPQIEVTFDIDANGILSVSAKDLATNKEQHITINNQNSLSQEEIDRIKADAEKFKEEDEKKKKELQELNICESYSYSVKQTLENENFKDKFTEEEKNQINEKLEALNKALEDRSNVKAIKSTKDELEKVFQPVITKLYEEAAKSANPEGAQQTSSNPFEQMGTDNPFANATQA